MAKDSDCARLDMPVNPAGMDRIDVSVNLREETRGGGAMARWVMKGAGRAFREVLLGVSLLFKRIRTMRMLWTDAHISACLSNFMQYYTFCLARA